MTFSPGPATTRYTSGNFRIENLYVIPADPAAVSVYGAGQVLVLNFDTFRGEFFPSQPAKFSNIALAQGVYKVTNMSVTHPVLSQIPAPTPSPQDPCIDGVQFLSIANVNPNPGVPVNTVFTESDGITFAVRPGQTSLSIKLDVQSFIPAYEAAYTCNFCGSNPVRSCLTGFNETTFRAAILANLRFQ